MKKHDDFVNKLYDNYSGFKHQNSSSIFNKADYYDEVIYDFIFSNYPDKDVRICDLGCGQGYKLATLSGMGYKNLLGCDVLCDKNNSMEGVTLIQQDIVSFLKCTNLKIFDVIILNAVLEHLNAWEIEGVLEHCAKVIDINGSIIIKSPNGSSPFGGAHQFGDLTHKTYLNEFSLKQVALLSGFSLYAVKNEMTSIRNSKGVKKHIVKAIQYMHLTALNIISVFVFHTKVVLTPNFIAVLKKNGLDK